MTAHHSTTPRRPDPSRAACTGQWSDFDPANEDEPRNEVRARWDRALTVCDRCPVIDQCEEWITGSPKRYRQGVVAGRIYLSTTEVTRRPQQAPA